MARAPGGRRGRARSRLGLVAAVLSVEIGWGTKQTKLAFTSNSCNSTTGLALKHEARPPVGIERSFFHLSPLPLPGFSHGIGTPDADGGEGITSCRKILRARQVRVARSWTIELVSGLGTWFLTKVHSGRTTCHPALHPHRTHPTPPRPHPQPHAQPHSHSHAQPQTTSPHPTIIRCRSLCFVHHELQ